MAGAKGGGVLCILTIGVIGLVLDRVMSLVEARFKSV